MLQRNEAGNSTWKGKKDGTKPVYIQVIVCRERYN